MSNFAPYLFAMAKTQEQVATDTLDILVSEKSLVVFNDHVNTFDFVIDSLIKVCKHERIQAEQCAHLIHFRGKYDVKHGEWSALEPMCTALLDRGITAEIH
jgi:ATP-dependent Clp protease adaptor protein ClpS